MKAFVDFLCILLFMFCYMYICFRAGEYCKDFFEDTLHKKKDDKDEEIQD